MGKQPSKRCASAPNKASTSTVSVTPCRKVTFFKSKITAEQVREFKDVGVSHSLDIRFFVKKRITPSQIQPFYTSAAMTPRFRRSGPIVEFIRNEITVETIESFLKAGVTNLSPHILIELCRLGVTASNVKALVSSGISDAKTILESIGA